MTAGDACRDDALPLSMYTPYANLPEDGRVSIADLLYGSFSVCSIADVCSCNMARRSLSSRSLLTCAVLRCRRN